MGYRFNSDSEQSHKFKILGRKSSAFIMTSRVAATTLTRLRVQNNAKPVLVIEERTLFSHVVVHAMASLCITPNPRHDKS